MATCESIPKSCTSLMNMVGVQVCAPSSSSPSVPDSSLSGSSQALTASSMVSLAMLRYVVHLPPAMVTRLLGEVWMTWLRTCGGFFSGERFKKHEIDHPLGGHFRIFY